MNPWIGWALAVAAIAVGYVQYGWQGALFGITLVVFWMLLQFNRAMRVMRSAAARPKGHVDSAVMLHAKLKPGMRMLEVLALTRSLGERVEVDAGAPTQERWRWADAGGDAVEITLRDGRCAEWRLLRAAEAAPAGAENAPL
ncbi:MAG: hypothetical protein ACOZJZ_04000 [Pseudomonadota bacterium]